MATTSSTTTSSRYIRSLIPARIDRLPWSKFHTRLVMALGVAWILDGLEITIAANVGPDLTLHEHAEHVRGRGQRHRLVVPDRRGHRRAVLRPAVRQARPEEPVHDHARRLPDRQRAHRGHAERRPLVHLPVRHPDHRRHGHRRRVRRDQLRDRRDDPGQVPGPGRPRGQRHVLGGRHPRHDRHAVGAQPRRAGLGLAGRLHRRPGARARHHLRAAQPARVAALADHARQAGRGRGVDQGDRGPRRGDHGRAAAGRREQGTGDPPRPSGSATLTCSRRCSGSTRPARCSSPR